ncbi:MAG: motility associated factor glycosyltransferase family protein [Spirochaetales bacterium]|nr:motility associated factor glycosyltransferase family protein [Spirochaetales bacterium]
MQSNHIFNRNQLSLSLHNEELALQLARCGNSKKISFKTARNGVLVPVLKHHGRDYALHSLFNPVKEGERSSAQISGGGYLVVFGFGACYHIRPLLQRDDINGILLIDKDITIIKSILSEIDLSDLLSDSRISILVDRSEDEITDYLPANYIPAVTGDFQTMTLRSRVETEKEYFSGIMNSIRKVLDTLSDDYTVQTWFGKRWFINSIANLAAAENSTTIIPPKKRVLIAAAGPSLEMQLDDIRKRQENSFLISTDTALSCLIKHSIKPDLVISIDCQQITYHHFMAGYPEDVPLVLDLASPPAVSRLTEKTLFFTSGHPFSMYVNRNWRKFPVVDTSGGNVTQAALSLADTLGASEIFIYGADYSYPEGKSYARGTYIYPYFIGKSSRKDTIESLFYKFLYRNENITMSKTDYGYRYTTRPMVSYKERLERYSSEVSGRIIPVPGLGEDIVIPSFEKQIKTTKNLLSAGRSRTDWKSFLSDYKGRLINLPEPAGSPTVYFSTLDYSDKDIWTTLFPVAAVLRKKYKDTEKSASDILSDVRSWALEVLNMYLD